MKRYLFPKVGKQVQKYIDTESIKSIYQMSFLAAVFELLTLGYFTITRAPFDRASWISAFSLQRRTLVTSVMRGMRKTNKAIFNVGLIPALKTKPLADRPKGLATRRSRAQRKALRADRGAARTPMAFLIPVEMIAGTCKGCGQQFSP